MPWKWMTASLQRSNFTETNSLYDSIYWLSYLDVTTIITRINSVIPTGVEFRRELQVHLDSPGWSLQESLDPPVFSLCETSDSLRESNCTLVDSFVGVFARVESRNLAEILTLFLLNLMPCSGRLPEGWCFPFPFPFSQKLHIYTLRGYCTPNLKSAGFVCYLKIINTFLKNNVVFN